MVKLDEATLKRSQSAETNDASKAAYSKIYVSAY